MRKNVEIGPSWSQDVPNPVQNEPRQAQEGPRPAQDEPKQAQEKAKQPQNEAKDGQDKPKKVSFYLEFVPSFSQARLESEMASGRYLGSEMLVMCSRL